MTPSARYVKIVEWSEEDGCYVGSSPGLFLGGCHENVSQRSAEELLSRLIAECELPSAGLAGCRGGLRGS